MLHFTSFWIFFNFYYVKHSFKKPSFNIQYNRYTLLTHSYITAAPTLIFLTWSMLYVFRHLVTFSKSTPSLDAPEFSISLIRAVRLNIGGISAGGRKTLSISFHVWLWKSTKNLSFSIYLMLLPYHKTICILYMYM